MTDFSLKLTFQGICTHFRYGVAAGVPHRVVLPDAIPIRTGLITVQDLQDVEFPIFYYIAPHFPQLCLAPNTADLTIPPSTESDAGRLMYQGDLRSGVRLQIVNAKESEIEYADEGVFSLRTFLPDYNFSSDVVLNGHAACYIDLFGGKVTTVTDCDGARRVQIQLTTDGPPILLATPLTPSRPYSSDAQNPKNKSYRIPLAQEGDPTDLELTVKNLEVCAEVKDEDASGGFDYLLHYLTARGGIPQSIATSTPGMPEPKKLCSATKEQLAESMRGLADLLSPPPPTKNGAALPRELLMLVTPSCSDSNYP